MIEELDSAFASTSFLIMLKLLIIVTLTFNKSIGTTDITITFLHASLNPEEPEVCAWPPKGYFPHVNILWKLKKTADGLRTAPKDWQDHFAITLQSCDFSISKSDGNVHFHTELQCIILAYVDGLIMFGRPSDVAHIQQLLKDALLTLEATKKSFLDDTFSERAMVSPCAKKQSISSDVLTSMEC